MVVCGPGQTRRIITFQSQSPSGTTRSSFSIIDEKTESSKVSILEFLNEAVGRARLYLRRVNFL